MRQGELTGRFFPLIPTRHIPKICDRQCLPAS